MFSYFFIAYDRNTPIGYFCFSYFLGEAELERICVIPDYQRKGVGSQMLSYAIDYLRELNCSKFMLEVRSKNYKAVSLYKKYGFEVDFIRKKYYPAQIMYVRQISHLNYMQFMKLRKLIVGLAIIY